MIADQNFYDICLMVFYPTASATANGQKQKFVRAKHSATAEGENYGSFQHCKSVQGADKKDTILENKLF